MKLLSVFIVLLSMFSCASFENGQVLNSVNINQSNFSVIGNAEGTAKSGHFLVILDVNFRKELLVEARNNMYKNFPLKKNEMYANTYVSYQTNFWFPFGIIYYEVKCTIKSDIIKFNN